ncbi:hypothetical protein MRX96_005593 [Rhipicephalus microplus]
MIVVRFSLSARQTLWYGFDRTPSALPLGLSVGPGWGLAVRAPPGATTPGAVGAAGGRGVTWLHVGRSSEKRPCPSVVRLPCREWVARTVVLGITFPHSRTFKVFACIGSLFVRPLDTRVFCD